METRLYGAEHADIELHGTPEIYVMLLTNITSTKKYH